MQYVFSCIDQCTKNKSMRYYTASQSRKIPALQKPPGHGFCFFIASCSRSISAFTVSTQDWNSAMGISMK